MQPYRKHPNLFFIGAMKSGTTYLTKLLSQHPSIFMVFPEEPSFFVERKYLRKYYPDQWKKRLWTNEDRYFGLFSEAGDEPLIGEGSTNYAKYPMIPGVPEAISDFNPASRFVYLVRDPVKRTISHYWHNVRYQAENRPMVEAIRDDPEYGSVSNYALQLKRYIDVFGPDAISVLTFEDLLASPEETLGVLFQELGVDPDFVPPGIGKAEHSTPPVVSKARGLGILKAVKRWRLWESVSPFLPRGLRSLGTRLAETTVEIDAVSPDEAIEYLRPIQQEQVHELAGMLNRSFSNWHLLWGTKAP